MCGAVRAFFACACVKSLHSLCRRTASPPDIQHSACAPKRSITWKQKGHAVSSHSTAPNRLPNRERSSELLIFMPNVLQGGAFNQALALGAETPNNRTRSKCAAPSNKPFHRPFFSASVSFPISLLTGRPISTRRASGKAALRRVMAATINPPMSGSTVSQKYARSRPAHNGWV